MLDVSTCRLKPGETCLDTSSGTDTKKTTRVTARWDLVPSQPFVLNRVGSTSSNSRWHASRLPQEEKFGTALAATVNVVETDDVVLAQVGPGLHLDDLQWHLAGVLQPMLGADRDVG